MAGKTILLIITGGIAAYKALTLIRLLKKAGYRAPCVLTAGGLQFVTPLSVSALAGEDVLCADSWRMDHIRLVRSADAIIIAPASADFLAKMACGLADDLATATLLATTPDIPVFVAPAMNPAMWDHPATQANVRTLRGRGVRFIGPCQGDAACGESGIGRMAEPEEVFERLKKAFSEEAGALSGKNALVTAGPTYEPIDPVRFIGNRSSGKQGYAIAAALAEAGADVTLVSGPVALPAPDGVRVVRVETAEQMLAACEAALPVDIAVCAAAVSDYAPYRIEKNKIKKDRNKTPQFIDLKENPDILQSLSTPGAARPSLVVGFAAETEDLLDNAAAKRLKKGCDWLLANDVGSENIFGADENHVYLVTDSGIVEWERAGKRDVAERLVREICDFMNEEHHDRSDRNRPDAA